MSMKLTELREKIEGRKARLAVIGLGYVGLPVACEFARAGFDVIGLEIRADRVEKINARVSPIEGDEPGLAELLADVIGSGKLRAASDYQALADRDVILIDVETPVDEDHIPRYKALESVLRSLGPVLKRGALVIVESTIAPGTMDRLVCPMLERTSGLEVSRDLFLGNCPERVMPGKLLANLRSLSRVVGGMTPETAETMTALYRHIVHADLDTADCVTAELVKTAENAYRDVQIAFANEVAQICESVGGDVWRVRELVNKSPGRQMLFPGAGVGGHCIPKDPWLLAYGAGDNVPVRLLPAARAINDGMPKHIANLASRALEANGCQVQGARVGVLGFAYLEDSDDTRNSPSEMLVQHLQEMGVEFSIHDPYVPEYQGDLEARIQGCDALILMVAHAAYKSLDLTPLKAVVKRPILVDGRRVFTAQQARSSGWYYVGVGEGTKAA